MKLPTFLVTQCSTDRRTAAASGSQRFNGVPGMSLGYRAAYKAVLEREGVERTEWAGN